MLAPRPAPPGGGRNEGNGGRAGEALGWRGPGFGPVPGFFRLLLPGWVCGLPVARRSGPASLSTGLSASSTLTFAGPWLFAHLGLGEDPQQALELGQYSALNAAPSQPSLSLFFCEMGERKSLRRVFVDSGRETNM